MALQGICTRANISPRKWLDMCVSLSSIHNVWAVMWKVVVCAGLFPSLPTSRYLPQNTHQQCNWVRCISVYSGTVCTRCTICSKKKKDPFTILGEADARPSVKLLLLSLGLFDSSRVVSVDFKASECQQQKYHHNDDLWLLWWQSCWATHFRNRWCTQPSIIWMTVLDFYSQGGCLFFKPLQKACNTRHTTSSSVLPK